MYEHDAPLTFGQLSVWRSLEALPLPRRVEGNVPRTWPDPMDLASGYGWRVALTDRTADGARQVLVVVHHIVADAWSWRQLQGELLAGDPPTEPGPRPVDLAREQRAGAAAGRRRAAVEYVSGCFRTLPSSEASAVPVDSGRRIQAELVMAAGIDLFDWRNMFNFMAPDLPSAPATGTARELRRQHAGRGRPGRADRRAVPTVPATSSGDTDPVRCATCRTCSVGSPARRQART